MNTKLEVEQAKMGKPESLYGYCPKCRAKGFSRERRPFGNDKCENGHEYPSAQALIDFSLTHHGFFSK